MNNEVLVLRTCESDGSSYGGFRWPLIVGAEVVAPDWDATPRCGGGLHGALHGEGDGTLFQWPQDAVWMVVAVRSESIVDLGGKVKFPACVIRFVGDRKGATDYIMENDALARRVIGAFVTSDCWGTSTSGHRGTSTSGREGTSTSGDEGTSTSGHRGTSTSGDRGTLQIKWYDGKRYRIATGYVGEDGILPNVAYRCDDNGNLVRA